NLVSGREQWGAADQPFKDLHVDTTPAQGSGSLPPGYPTNHNYGAPGNVVDADPRLISNLIVDQTLENPAAIMAALEHAGVTGSASTIALGEITTAYNAFK